MTMFYEARELADSTSGAPLNRYRMIGLSDEDKTICRLLCHCIAGHLTKKEARDCPEAKAKLDKLFPKN